MNAIITRRPLGGSPGALLTTSLFLLAVFSALGAPGARAEPAAGGVPNKADVSPATLVKRGVPVRNTNLSVLFRLTEDTDKVCYFCISACGEQLDQDSAPDGNSFDMVSPAENKATDLEFLFQILHDAADCTGSLRMSGRDGVLIHEFRTETKYDQPVPLIKDLTHQAYVWIRDGSGKR